MVKGTAKRVIVVKSPDKKVFEEAIFIVREDYMRTSGITQAKLMDEAKAAAAHIDRTHDHGQHQHHRANLIQ